MRLSKLYMPTLRETPADAEVPSHQLMLRSAMIRRLASGAYSYLPLGWRVIQKIENIVREEMDRAGAQEMIVPMIHPQEIWEESGRWGDFGPEMFRLTDRNGREFCLGPTAEEAFTFLVRGELKSYKQLPINLYQISNKYRDEARPRFGVNRAREFLMKDAYSFDTNAEGMEKSYNEMHDAYVKVFDRLDLDYKVVLGDSGAMGGDNSEEFMALATTGEGVIVYTEGDDYAATDEKAKVNYPFPEREEPREMELAETPNCVTIEDVSQFFGVKDAVCAKALDLMVQEKPVFVFIPGDRDLNIVKLAAYLGVGEHEIGMMDEETILAMGSFPGFTGPRDLNEEARIIIDESLTKMDNLVIGANKKDHHYKNANYGRDFDGEIAPDLLMVKEGDVAEDGQKLEFARGIEVGNIFQLGTKYSEGLHATYLDENGKEQFFWMGCYGIGVTRSCSAIIEQHHDDYGIIWPINVAPYEAVVTIVNTKDDTQVELGEKIYKSLLDQGVEALIDDRNERPGIKFNDRDLIGIPLRITVGRDAGEDIVELSTRRDGKNFNVKADHAIEQVVKAAREENIDLIGE